jgi:hypothetical protein
MAAPVKKLNDRFADYDLSIKGKRCGHVRVTGPHALAKILGLEATLETVASRLLCSKCNVGIGERVRRSLRAADHPDARGDTDRAPEDRRESFA